jgi:hypothetical protein
VRQGKACFGLHVEPPLLVLLWSFVPALPWSDAPFSWHLLPPSERDLPSADLSNQTRTLLRIVLVDASTGHVRAIRAITLGPTFTRALHTAIRDQATQAWDESLFDQALARLYARVSAEELAGASTVRGP